MRIGRCCLKSILHGPRALAVTHSGTYWMAGVMTSQAPKVSKRQTVINIRIAEDTGWKRCLHEWRRRQTGNQARHRSKSIHTTREKGEQNGSVGSLISLCDCSCVDRFVGVSHCHTHI